MNKKDKKIDKEMKAMLEEIEYLRDHLDELSEAELIKVGNSVDNILKLIEEEENE